MMEEHDVIVTELEETAQTDVTHGKYFGDICGDFRDFSMCSALRDPGLSGNFPMARGGVCGR